MNKSKSKSRWQSKFFEWLRRYGPAELMGIVTAYLGYFAGHHLFHNDIITAYMAAMGENVGFYGVIIVRELLIQLKRSEHTFFSNLTRTIIHIGTEFGPAEALDSLVLRPLFMGLGIKFFGPLAGVMTGKIAADVTFYVPVIISYEVRQYLYRRGKKK